MSDSLEDRLRKKLHPRLELIKPIGQGEHAHVFLARHHGLKQLVAVKVLRPNLTKDPVMRKRFDREAQATAQLDHPNVVRIFDVQNFDDDIPCIIMKYVDGRTLSDAIAATGSLPWHRARPILADLAAALATAHGRGIVHRDVRPANVFLDRETGRAVLGDFGIAGLIETGSDTETRLTKEGQRLSAAHYSSPEQLLNEPAVEQSDVYAFGIVVWETLTGNDPWRTKSDSDVIEAHLHRAPPSIVDYVPDVDPQIGELLDHCLEKAPNRRPTARDLSDRLRTAELVPTPVPNGGAIGRFWHELKRRRVGKVALWYLGSGCAGVIALGEFVGILGGPNGIAQAAAVAYVAGIPVALILSWIFDIRAGRITRTRYHAGRGTGVLPWIALVFAALLSGVLGWLLLKLLEFTTDR